MNDATGDTMGQRITLAREVTNLSTAQLARRLGVKTTTLTQWESDRSEPRANRLMTLAGVLNVSPAWLLVGDGAAPAGDPTSAALHMTRNELASLQEDAEHLVDRISRALERVDRVLGERES